MSRNVDEQSIPNTGFQTLDEFLWKSVLNVEEQRNPAKALEKMGLLVADEGGSQRASVAGILMCAENPETWLPNACIKATCYRGKDRASGHIDSADITGSVVKQISGAVDFAVKNMRVAARKAPARENLPQYSEESLFEAIVNAVIHRDYSIKGESIRLSMFEDRLEIQSPGKLLNGVTDENLASRQATRNEVLVKILSRMPVAGMKGTQNRAYILEGRGNGIPIIQKKTEELSGKQPQFKTIDNAVFQVTIPAAILEHVPIQTAVTAYHEGRPAADICILALFPNKTGKEAVSDAEGRAILNLHSSHLPMTVFAAGSGYAAKIERNWIPSERALALNLRKLPGGGSLIFSDATGCIPNVSGRLNPIRDADDRTYLYAANISINEGRQQPVHFSFGEDLRLTDAEGRGAVVRIVEIIGQSAVVEYER